MFLALCPKTLLTPGVCPIEEQMEVPLLDKALGKRLQTLILPSPSGRESKQ